MSNGAAAITTDTDLLLRIAQHEEQALATLYDRYGNSLYSLALDITSESAAAERVVEQVFAALWSSTRTRPTTEVGRWLAMNTRLRALVVARQKPAFAYAVA